MMFVMNIFTVVQCTIDLSVYFLVRNIKFPSQLAVGELHLYHAPSVAYIMCIFSFSHLLHLLMMTFSLCS